MMCKYTQVLKLIILEFPEKQHGTVLSLTGKVGKKKHFSGKISSKYVEVVQNVTDRRKRFKSV